MTDLIANVNGARLRKIESAERESLRPAIVMLFFAYRDFTSGPDKILQEFGFGRAHHRVIYFVGRNPNLTISDLLVILKITKQSLNRVLRPLVKEGFIKKSISPHDRRKKFLNLTEKGGKVRNSFNRDTTIYNS